MAPADQDNLSLQEQYGDRYNQIVRPDRVFAVSHYLRTRWAPLLGAARLWFVVALRQRCYWNDRQDWFIADKKTLARESGLSLRTVNRIIAAVDHVGKTNDRDALTAWFFDKTRRRRYRQQVGRTVNAPNRYHVLLDDPLTPADQRALSDYLRHNLTDSSPEGTLALLENLSTQSSTQLYEILSLDQVLGDEPTVCTSLFTFDLVTEQCPMPDRQDPLYTQIARAASDLHNKITRPEHVYVGNQYFRLQWLPTLGPVLSSLVVNLRARCYWDRRSGELRDTCTASWTGLAQEIGCTPRQLRNLRDHPDLSRFVVPLEGGHTFKVQIPDPLTEADRERFAQETGRSIDPETGQVSFAELLAYRSAPKRETLASREPENAEEMALTSLPEAEVLAPGDRKEWHIEGLTAEVLAHAPGNSGTTVKVHIMTPTQKGLTATTLDLTPELQQDEQNLAAAARTHLLTHLGIQPPGLGKILAQKPSCETIVAWGLYALTQPGLSENRAGYVYRRLLDQDRAPSDMLSLASLSVSHWQELDRDYRQSPVFTHSYDLMPARELWRTYLSSVWDMLDIRLGDDLGQDEPVVIAPPEALAALLRERERLSLTPDGRWEVITSDLYRAYQLLTAERVGWEDVPVSVHFSDGLWIYALPAEWLTLDVAPIREDQWRVVQEELQMVMPRHVYAQRWQQSVSPFGLCEPGRVLLGVSSLTDREWLEAWQKENVERILHGVLERQVQVEFWGYEFPEDERQSVQA